MRKRQAKIITFSNCYMVEVLGADNRWYFADNGYKNLEWKTKKGAERWIKKYLKGEK